MDQSIILDPALIAQYDQSGPRYTSYPTAVEFHDGFTEVDYRVACERGNAARRPLSLYFHIPFCDTVCFYCACNKIATKDRSLAQPYLERVYRELALHAALIDRSRPVEQLHWGGGTPTFISHAQMRALMAETRRHFTLVDDDSGEFSIEIDPREANAETVHLLREIGFNRMSLGVQDFDPQVQRAVNRIQTEAETREVLEAARREGFRSISIDLIYGLPLQSVARFTATLERVIALNPDRLSLFNYAHLPQMFPPQRRISVEELPAPAVKLDILHTAIDRLTRAGYVFIGMDHFARPNDELARAQREGTLYRNFQGYSTHANCDVVGLGVTAIGMTADTYSQNVKTLAPYYEALDAGRLPLLRGLALKRDDQIRREVITQLICHFRLNFAAIETRWGIEFQDYFQDALAQLARMAQDGLLALTAQGIQVQPRGRLLIRNICMAFDTYLTHKQGQTRFSKVI
jgi:oxygen-independent coproporphyrinogen III oxidase